VLVTHGDDRAVGEAVGLADVESRPVPAAEQNSTAGRAKIDGNELTSPTQQRLPLDESAREL